MSIGQLQLKREEKLIAMGQMAASLAHEIRNPLGSMELNIGLLKRTLKDNDQVSNYLSELHRSVRTLNHIVTNSLQFTKDIVPKKQVFTSAKKFLSEICLYFGKQSEETENLYKGDLVDIYVTEIGNSSFSLDPYLIGQVLLNLISNAIQASEGSLGEASDKNKLRGLVNIDFDHSKESSFSITIRDDGPGICAEHIDQIFDPFFTTKEKGTGLGLAIVHSIITAHKGEILVRNLDSEGVEFKIIFSS